MSDLVGRSAVVTGGGSGLGAAMAPMFADAGMDVAVMGFAESLREEVAPEGIGVTIVFPGGRRCSPTSR